MNKDILNILKSKNYIMPNFLLTNYKKLDLSEDLTILLTYLINLDSPIVCDYKKFSNETNISQKEVMGMINELSIKKMLEIKVSKNSSGKFEEYINLDLFYNKIFMIIIDNKDEETSNIYSIFEKELNRTLSPIEYELINGWLECGYKEEIIISGLREAVFSGVNNFRYIDKILSEWSKKGIDSIDKVEKNKKEYKKTTQKVEVPDYDWLSENE